MSESEEMNVNEREGRRPEETARTVAKDQWGFRVDALSLVEALKKTKPAGAPVVKAEAAG